MPKLPLFSLLLFLVLVLPLGAQEPEQDAPLKSAPKSRFGFIEAGDEPVAGPPTDLFARDSYRVDPVVCPFKGEIKYEPGDIECGLLQVPKNRENPASR